MICLRYNARMKGIWSTVQIGGKPAEIYRDQGGIPPRFGILYLHDSNLESLRERPAFCRWFDELNLACVCPHGARCWWGDRICGAFDRRGSPERYLLDRVLPFLGEQWQLPPRSVGLLGIGMGGQGALRLAFKHPDLFSTVVALAAAVDYHELYGQGGELDDMYDSKEQCRQDTALMHIHPSHYPPHIFFGIDPDDVSWYRGNDRLHEKLAALGVPHEIDFATRAGGHTWDYYNHMAERAVRFIQAGLEQESRRLL
ncbi:MAG: esterase [Planctomycetota bacterium]|nr:MAG: esterase [Planctomycetota bacterium]